MENKKEKQKNILNIKLALENKLLFRNNNTRKKTLNSKPTKLEHIKKPKRRNIRKRSRKNEVSDKIELKSLEEISKYNKKTEVHKESE